MGFHRRTTPTYPGGLPGGYDYINNPALNGDPGLAAPVDGKKASGPNQGSYFVTFTEAAKALAPNRGLDALAENCDILDNYVRAGQPVIRRTDFAGGGAPVASILLNVNNVYVGSGSDTPSTANDQATRNRLFKVVDQNDNEIEVSGTTVVVSLVHDGSSNNYVGNVAGGFVNTPTLNFTPSIPTGQAYRVYYGSRRNTHEILTQKAGELVYEQIRSSHRVTGDVQATLRVLHNAAGTGLWNAAWPSTLDDLRYGGFDRTYRNDSAKPITSPDTDRYPLNTSGAGNGAWMRRDGKALSMYSADAAAYVDPSQALQRLVFADTTQIRGSVGLLVEASYREGSSAAYAGESDRHTGFASFLVADVRRTTGSAHATNPRTRVLAGSSVTLTTLDANPATGESTVLLPAGSYFRQTGTFQTDVALGYDVIRLRFTQAATVRLRDYVIVAFGESGDANNIRKAKVRCLDGSIPDFTGASAATVVEWLRWGVGRGDGSGHRYVDTNGSGPTLASPADGFMVIGGTESLDGLLGDVPVSFGGRFAVRRKLSTLSDPFEILSAGYFDLGDYNAVFTVESGDPTNTSGNLPRVRVSPSAYMSGARSVTSRFGAHAMQTVTPAAFTSATTTQALDLNAGRFFKLTCNGTVTSFQSISLTFSAIAITGDLLEQQKMVVVFTQQASGTGNAVLTWPVSAVFESVGDSLPAAGLSKVTIWEGTFINSNWYFTKRVY